MAAVIVDGKQIARDIVRELAVKVEKMSNKPRIDIFICAPNGAIKSFVARKRRTAKRIGIEFVEHLLENTVTTEEIQEEIEKVIPLSNGIVVQLPMPKHIDTEKLLNNLPTQLDVDVLGDHTFDAFVAGEVDYEPPVAGAVREILQRHDVETGGKDAVMIGRGKLVGLPTEVILDRLGCNVFEINRETPEDVKIQKIKDADIVVSGTGVANLVTPDMIKDNVVLIDAGTSGSKATLAGDIDYACEEKAGLFSRTPGGVGPITVAILFRNLMSGVLSK